MPENHEEAHENPDNIAYYCQEHSPKPIGYKGSMADLVGKWVKVRFTDPVADVAGEHMWVKVEAVTGDTAIGYLDNKPFHVKNIHYRDPVTVAREDIEAVYG